MGHDSVHVFGTDGIRLIADEFPNLGFVAPVRGINLHSSIAPSHFCRLLDPSYGLAPP
jgi:hypothetical protein